ncbi:MAG: hypothetical protein QXH18_02485 [Candidatus Micrarchaeia archaeon]
MRKLFTIVFLSLIFSIVFAQSTTSTTSSSSEKIKDAICAVYDLLNGLLPVMAFVLFVLAGVAYAAGNFFGAEMRAKATGWAMNMITGAIIALILSAVGPSILSYLYQGEGSINADLCS